MSKPILIYADLGTSEVGVQSLLKNIPRKLGIPAETVTARQILQGALTQAIGLVIAGGADLPYAEKLNGEGNRLIRAFVAQGGFYLGICAGAYYACREIEFDGNSYQIYAKRKLALFDGTGKGSFAELAGGNLYDETFASKAFISLKTAENRSFASYYHGGCAFLAPEQAVEKPQTFAKYPNNLAAVITGQFGKGRYVLSGVHFELDQQCYRRQHCTPNNPFAAQEYAFSERLTPHYGEPVWILISTLLKNKANQV